MIPHFTSHKTCALCAHVWGCQNYAGPETFNYGFPQELDNEYLVISDHFSGVPWKYVDSAELIAILCERIDKGFTFPLNPKWILCDPGWKVVYDRLLASCRPNVQDAIDVWYPPEVRDKIARISSLYPGGFKWQPLTAAVARSSSGADIGVKTDLAMLELRRFLTRQNGQRNLKTIMTSLTLASKLSLGKESGQHITRDHFMAAMEMNHLHNEQQIRFLANLENGNRRSMLKEQKGMLAEMYKLRRVSEKEYEEEEEIRILKKEKEGEVESQTPLRKYSKSHRTLGHCTGSLRGQHVDDLRDRTSKLQRGHSILGHSSNSSTGKHIDQETANQSHRQRTFIRRTNSLPHRILSSRLPSRVSSFLKTVRKHKNQKNEKNTAD